MEDSAFLTPKPDLATLSIFVVLLVLVPVALAVIAASVTNSGEHAMAKIVAIVLIPSVLLGGLLYGLCFGRPLLQVDNRLVARSGIYKYDLPVAALGTAKPVIYGREEAFVGDRRLGIRTNGVGLPGFKLGWFTCKDGQRAFVWLGQEPFVLWISRTGQNHLVLGFSSIDEARRFVAQLGLKQDSA